MLYGKFVKYNISAIVRQVCRIYCLGVTSIREFCLIKKGIMDGTCLRRTFHMGTHWGRGSLAIDALKSDREF